MSSSASIGKHPVHPMLVAFPIGLWVFALVCDIVWLFGGAQVWSTVAFYSIAGGIVGALLAAIAGFIDYLSIDEAEMRRIATTHLLLGLSSVVVFGLNLWLRFRLGDGSKIPILPFGDRCDRNLVRRMVWVARWYMSKEWPLKP